MSDALSLGVFRSTWGRKATLLEANPAMRDILGLPVAADLTGADWLERIIDPEERSALVDRLNKDKAVQDYRLGLRREDGGRADVSLFAVLVDDENGQPGYLRRHPRGHHQADQERGGARGADRPTADLALLPARACHPGHQPRPLA